MRNEEYYQRVKKRIDGLLKPLDSLGHFENIIAELGAVLKDEEVRLSKPALLVFCADNGIIEEGVSQSDEGVTENVTRMLGLKRTSVCHMARYAGIEVYPFDIGVKNSEDFEGVDLTYHIKNGTSNFLKEEAMSEAEMTAAINSGKEIVDRLYSKGTRVILLGEMGIGNTTTSAAVISALLKLEPEAVCGRGSGLSNQGLEKKKEVIKSAINKYDLYNSEPLKVLQSVGGFDIASMVGAIMKAGELSIPVILDGVITCAAALVAVECDSSLSDVLFLSHKGRERGIELCSKALNKEAVIDGNLALGEGTGAVLFYNMLSCVLEVYHSGLTFEEANIEAYTRFV